MAESDLSKLLETLSVIRRDGVWRFETIDKDEASWTELVTLRDVRNIAMLFQESEGLTVITSAEAATPQNNRWIWLELSVYSDLQAVGFLAKVANALAKARRERNETPLADCRLGRRHLGWLKSGRYRLDWTSTGTRTHSKSYIKC